MQIDADRPPRTPTQHRYRYGSHTRIGGVGMPHCGALMTRFDVAAVDAAPLTLLCALDRPAPWPDQSALGVDYEVAAASTLLDDPSGRLAPGCGTALSTLSAPTTRMRMAQSFGMSPLTRPKMATPRRTSPSTTASAGW